MPKPPSYVDEHVRVRKGWGEYVKVVTELRRAEAHRTSEYVRGLRARLRRAQQTHPSHR